MKHTIKNEYLTVTAAELGAELQSIRSAEGIEHLWQGDSKYWSDRALNLFPYVARLTDGSYDLDGKRYSMPIHGLAPYTRFSLVSNDGQTMVLEMTDTPESLAQYPRHFAFRIHYVLKDNVLETTYEVENRDEKPMYFGLGGHPGFNVPFVPGKRFEDYRLRFAQRCYPWQIVFSEDCFVTGDYTSFPLEDKRILPLRHDLFDNDAIVLQSMARQVVLECEGDSHSVTLSFPDMPYLSLWHWPKTDAPYICIEPWRSLPSPDGEITILEEQKDLVCLEAGKTYRNTWTIEIS